MKKVIVGLSGGVDSSVAAYLLKAQGYEVIGLFMKNWHDDSVTISDECPWLEDSNDALLVAEKLGIPFQTVDLSEDYKTRIVDYMFSEYESGRTPNPDVLCNREIKFDVFLKIALSLGADFVATGHYCQKETIRNNGLEFHRLLAGKDSNKDQSYFLCQLSQEQLSKTLFPIGHLTKPEVRKIAFEQNLVTAEKKDSQGLCFVGKVHLPDFLQQKLKPKEGNIVEVSAQLPMYHSAVPDFSDELERLAFNAQKRMYKSTDGQVIGKHIGAHFYTIGQRKGLNVGGKAEPIFIIDTDVFENVIYVGQGKSHPGLFKKTIFISDADTHWVRPDLKVELCQKLAVRARIRYRQPLQNAVLHQADEGIYIDFEQPQSAVTPGQFTAWYLGEELIGSGVIS